MSADFEWNEDKNDENQAKEVRKNNLCFYRVACRLDCWLFHEKKAKLYLRYSELFSHEKVSKITTRYDDKSTSYFF